MNSSSSTSTPNMDSSPSEGVQRLPAGQPAIRGGSLPFSASNLHGLLDAWRLPRTATLNGDDTPYVLLEQVDALKLVAVDEITTGSQIRLDHPDLLERLRIFGPGGDFEVRRDEERLYWRWIECTGDEEGRQVADLSTDKQFAGADFWAQTPPPPDLLRHETRLLLWGQWDDKLGGWFDDRVAGSQLSYPGMEGCERVYVHGWEFISNGATQFVWWRELKEGVS